MKKPSKPTFPLPDSDLQLERPPSARRKTRASGLPRLKRAGFPSGKRSRPETPLLKWKIEDNEDDRERRKDQNDLDEEREEGARRDTRKGRKGREVPMSARKLAAGLWRLQLPEMGVERRTAQLGFQVRACIRTSNARKDLKFLVKWVFFETSHESDFMGV